MKGLYVTGTDTGVGKTLITAALARAFYRRGRPVRVAKPFASGAWEDTRILKKAAFSPDPLNMITPFYFRYPLAPLVSLQLEKRILRAGAIRKRLRNFKKNGFRLLAEGIGGAAVPITADYDAIDVARTLKLSVVIVARLSLGTLNHTSLTVQHARRKKVKIKGIIMNAYPSKMRGWAEKTNSRTIERMTGVPVLGIMPFVPAARRKDYDYLARLAEKHIEVDNLLC